MTGTRLLVLAFLSYCHKVHSQTLSGEAVAMPLQSVCIRVSGDGEASAFVGVMVEGVAVVGAGVAVAEQPSEQTKRREELAMFVGTMARLVAGFCREIAVARLLSLEVPLGLASAEACSAQRLACCN